MKLLPLSKNGKNKGKYFAKVDSSDFEWLNQWNWNLLIGRNTNYAKRTEYNSGKPIVIRLHSFIMNANNIDHKNGDGLDCQRDNMRTSARSQNGANRIKKAKGTSKYLGVFKNKYKNDIEYYQAQIKHNGKIIYIGRFESEIKAAFAYNKKALEIHGNFAKLNIIN